MAKSFGAELRQSLRTIANWMGHPESVYVFIAMCTTKTTMRVYAYSHTWWNSAEDAAAKGEGRFGLKAWHERVQKYLNPVHCFVACGTWSEPSYSPIPVPVINAGAPEGQYDVRWCHYAGCALTAGHAYALTRNDWDLLFLHDTDMLIGAVDFDSLLKEFMQRPEEMLDVQWNGGSGCIMCLKRAGVSRFLHQRRRANIIEDRSGPEPMLIETEIAEIFKGRWWNPWPHIKSIRQDYGLDPNAADKNEEVMSWPFVRMPHPDIIDRYTETQTSQAKPVQP